MVQASRMRTRLWRNALAEPSVHWALPLKEAAREVREVRVAERPGPAMVSAVVSVRETALALASLAPLAQE